MNDHPSLSEKQNPAYVRMRRTTLGAHGHPPARVEFSQLMSSQMTPSIATSSDHLQPSDRFAPRHLGPRPEEQEAMLSALGLSSMTELLFEAIPDAIRNDDPLNLRPAASESEAASVLRQIMSKNHVLKSAIGAGYHNCLIPSVRSKPNFDTSFTSNQCSRLIVHVFL